MQQNTINKGDKVKHARFGEGEVISIKENKIKVVFGGLEIKEFSYPQDINNGTLICKKLFPTINLNKNHNVFFCFQGLQYYNELEGGYIFALPDGISHHERLRDAKVGNVIFHCYKQKISSISVVQREACLEKRPKEHYLANDKPYGEGLMVKTKYLKLKTPIITSQYKNEIKKMQGDHEGMGYPFNKNGEGNEGYLFNLNKSLANFFLNEIIKCNSDLLNNQNIQALLQENKEEPKKSMKLCPICGLNWIEDDENCCSVCDKQNSSIGNKGTGGGGKKQTAYFQEEFTFTNQKAFYRGKAGFQAHNSKGENVGLVFMTDDPRTPAYGHCELCIYAKYYNRYGEWHRIISNGGRIKWGKLCEILEQKTTHKVFID